MTHSPDILTPAEDLVATPDETMVYEQTQAIRDVHTDPETGLVNMDALSKHLGLAMRGATALRGYEAFTSGVPYERVPLVEAEFLRRIQAMGLAYMTERRN